MLVLSYAEETRTVLSAALQRLGVSAISCETFQEAEDRAVGEVCAGILVDLTAMVKAKDQEKAIACSLANIYPTLRVRVMGGMLIPMTMPGGAMQDKSLNDFVLKTCAAFPARRLRTYRRVELCLPVVCTDNGGNRRAIMRNISPSGAFIMDLHPEGIPKGTSLALDLYGEEEGLAVEVVWTQSWGERRMPGYGVRFSNDARWPEIIERLIPPVARHSRDRLLG